MRATRLFATATLAMGTLFGGNGCARTSSGGPVAWTASNPSSPVGQSAAQSWSRSTASDTPRAPDALSSTYRKAPPVWTCARATDADDTDTPESSRGVTNAQPVPKWPYQDVTLSEPAPRWPYNGFTLELGWGPP
jgi:hypothetical protein